MFANAAGDGALEPVLTPLPYTRDQAASIRASAEAGAVVDCPACGHVLTYGPPVRHRGHRVRELFCAPCNRIVVLTLEDGKP